MPAPARLTGPRLWPIASLAAFALLLTLAAPAAAAPGATAGAPSELADHVTDCNVTFDAQGNLLLDDVLLSGAQAAVLDTVLAADATLAAVLALAAEANAETCVNLAIDLLSATVELNATTVPSRR